MHTISQKIISNKLGLLNLAEELQNVSRACKIMGFSRDTFYRYRDLKTDGGVGALIDKSRKKPNFKNRVEDAIEQAVVSLATEFPAFGQKRASNELRKRTIFISPGGVRGIWLRHNLETFKKRIKALEEVTAKSGIILTEAQISALEKKKEDELQLQII